MEIIISNYGGDLMKLFSVGDSNWDIYAGSENEDNIQRTYLYAIAKKNGARNSGFGDLRHIVNLIREEIYGDELTDYGRELMERAGFGNVVKEYERQKKWRVDFMEWTHGKVIRSIFITANCRHKAYCMAYDMRNANEKAHEVVMV